jgi:Rps23 Pro-64 3,4-dihydroxylase Tpa1-like proline 4-hydroxylase
MHKKNLIGKKDANAETYYYGCYFLPHDDRTSQPQYYNDLAV